MKKKKKKYKFKFQNILCEYSDNLLTKGPMKIVVRFGVVQLYIRGSKVVATLERETLGGKSMRHSDPEYSAECHSGPWVAYILN